MNLSFEYINKSDFFAASDAVFDILAENMTVIAPTGNTRDYDYKCWRGCVSDALQHDERQIILIKDNENLAGYFQYCTNEDTFMMEEIQLRPEYRGKGVFRELYGFILKNIRNDLEYVEAYASINNRKSIGILERFGLLNISLNKNGRSYHFKGKYSDLLKWYFGKE